MKIFKTLLSLAVLIVVFTSCNNTSTKSDKIKLNLIYEKGFEKIIYTNTTASQGDMMSMNSIMELKFKLVEVLDNSYRFAVDVKRITSNTKMYDETEIYDSDKPEAEMNATEREMHAAFAEVLNSDFFIEIDKQGKVIKPFYLKDGTPYSGDIIEMPTLQIVFPDHEVAIGDQWKNESMVTLTKQKKEFTYTLKEVNDKEIVIEMTAETKGMKSGLGKLLLKGTYHLDRKTNQLIKADMKSDMGGDGKMSLTIEQK